MVVSPHGRPLGPGMPSAFSLRAISRGERAAAYSRKIPPNYVGLARVDRPAAGDRAARGIAFRGHLVAITEAAAGAPGPHPAFQAGSRLHRQILQEQRVRRALEADVQLADLPLGEGYEPHAGKAQLLVEGGRVLRSRDSRSSASATTTSKVPGACVLQQLLIARPQPAGAANRMIGVGVDQRIASAFWKQRRARHLLTGLARCGVCGNPLAAVGRDYLACGAARRQEVCGNRRAIRREVLESIILDALRSRLMQPDSSSPSSPKPGSRRSTGSVPAPTPA